MDLNIKLSVKNAQYILNVLGQRPYTEVHELIMSIKTQGDAQIAENDKPPAEKAPA
jgi:hypothetical protein